MGVLDDAIREHLDLKRRRGADPSEVERAEREALGPVRREPEEVVLDHADVDDQALEPDLAAESERGLEEDEELPYEDGATEWDDALAREPDSSRDAPVFDIDLPADPALGATEAEDHVKPTPPPTAAPSPSEPFDHGDETAEFDVEHALKQEKTKEGDDVLEETPEFLQDTPDHDRLWFEQKPPRDFDFDG